MLENFASLCKNMIDCQKKNNTDYTNFLTFLLPEYEKNCLVEYVNNYTEGKYIFANPSDNKFTEIMTVLVLYYFINYFFNRKRNQDTIIMKTSIVFYYMRTEELRLLDKLIIRENNLKSKKIKLILF